MTAGYGMRQVVIADAVVWGRSNFLNLWNPCTTGIYWCSMGKKKQQIKHNIKYKKTEWEMWSVDTDWQTGITNLSDSVGIRMFFLVIPITVLAPKMEHQPGSSSSDGAHRTDFLPLTVQFCLFIGLFEAASLPALRHLDAILEGSPVRGKLHQDILLTSQTAGKGSSCVSVSASGALVKVYNQS